MSSANESKKGPWHQGILGGKSRDYMTTGIPKQPPVQKQVKPKVGSKRKR